MAGPVIQASGKLVFEDGLDLLMLTEIREVPNLVRDKVVATLAKWLAQGSAYSCV